MDSFAMKLLFVGSDRNLFETSSAVSLRMKEYASLVDSLNVIVFTKRKFSQKRFASFTVYPTRSWSRLLYPFDAFFVARRIERPDVVSAQDPFEAGLAAYFISWYYRTPFEVQIHTDFLTPEFKRESLLNRLRCFIAGYIIPKASGVRVVSERIKNSIIREYHLEKNPTVIPIYIDFEEIQNKQSNFSLKKSHPTFDSFVLVLSRLTKEKQIDCVIESMKKVIKERPSTALVVVGDGPEKITLQKKVKRYQLDSHVFFYPWTTTPADFYKEADLFLLTSSYEGYGRTVAEALSFGVPVISFDVGDAITMGAQKTSKDTLSDDILAALRIDKRGALKGYPYKNKEDYLNALKKAWESCI